MSNQKKNILVTDECGFIGSNFIRMILNNPTSNVRIVNVDLLTYAGNQKNLTDIYMKTTGYFSIL